MVNSMIAWSLPFRGGRYVKSLIDRDTLVNIRSSIDPSLSSNVSKLDGVPLVGSVTC